MEQRKLDEFIKRTCDRIYRNGRTRYSEQYDSNDEPRWHPRGRVKQNLMVRDGRIVEIGSFGNPRPPGRPQGSPNKRSRWELPSNE